MTRLWLIAGSILTVGTLGFGTVHVVNLLAHEEVTETATFAADGVTDLDIGNTNGSIEIVGDDVDEISLVAEISHGLRQTDHTAAIDGSSLVVRSSCPFLSTWCSVDYRLVVPTDLAVTARLDNGHLVLRDLDGAVDVDGDNGRIELVRLEGDVRASTDNGRLEGTGLRAATVLADSDNGQVSLSFADAPTSVTATSDNGGVEVVVPDTAATYRVDVQTDNGSTDVGVRTDPTSDRSITAETDNGSVTVRYPSG